VFELRGSRASLDDSSDADAVTRAFEDRITSKVKGARFKLVRYDAIPVGYQAAGMPVSTPGVWVPVWTARHARQEIRETVPASRMASWVTTRAQMQPVHQRLEVSQPDSSPGISSESPGHNSRQPQINGIPNGGKRDGILSALNNGRSLLLTIPSGLTKKVHTYCLPNDPVCDYTKRYAVLCYIVPDDCAHVAYVSKGWVRDGANWAINVHR
jgi:hypothetical protein